MTLFSTDATILQIIGGVTMKYLLLLSIPMLLIGYELKVEVQELVSSEGQLFIGLYKDEKNFTDVKKFYQGEIIKAVVPKVSHTFINIPKGKYSIALFHDENNNGKLDKNFFGLPEEGHGFSNNVQGILSRPSFEQCSFRLQTNQTKQIKVRY